MDDTPLERWRQEEAARKEAFRATHPNHRLITRGPRKGQIVRLTRKEHAKRHRLDEERRKTELALNPPAPSPSPKSDVGYQEATLFIVAVIALPIGSYFALSEMAKGLQCLHLLPFLEPLIICDYIAWRRIAPKYRHARYLPVLWWVFGRG